MYEIDLKKKEIYKRNVFLPSQNNICGIVTKNNAAYKCPSKKFCNNSYEGICENTDCKQYTIFNSDIDIRKFDGSDVSRNKITTDCNRAISTDGKCGLDNNSTKCPTGQCCSMKGTCGYDKESCLYISKKYNNSTPQYISPNNNNFSNNMIAYANRNYFSNRLDVDKYEDEFIKQIGNKYIGNNNFDTSANINGSCGIDLDNEKIFKCIDNKYCNRYSKCSTDYNNYNGYNDNVHLNFPDLSLNLIHGDKFNEEYNKWLNCNNNIILDSFKTSFYNKMGTDISMVNIVKINKVDDKTCDIKFNFTGKKSGIDSRRIKFQYKPDIKKWICTDIGDEMSGRTLITQSLYSNTNNFFISPFVIVCLFIVSVILIALIVYLYLLKKKENNKA